MKGIFHLHAQMEDWLFLTCLEPKPNTTKSLENILTGAEEKYEFQ